MERLGFEAEHEAFRESVRRFVTEHVVPHREDWERTGRVGRELFRAAGAVGILGVAAPEEYGGGGVDDFRYNAILSEELATADVLSAGLGLSLQADIALPYLLHNCTPEQAARWLPAVVSGETILALAMSEPGAGSDVARIATTAARQGDHYVVNGSKTFITNALNADLIVTAVKTDPSAGRKGISLLVIETDAAGFSRGPKLAKVGQHAADTAELFFDDLRVPVANLLGEEGRGFYVMMKHLAQERLAVTVQATAQARRAFEICVEYAKGRHAFGQPIGSFQHNRFLLAEMKTEVEIAQTYVDRLLLSHVRGELTAVEAAQGKWWTTELCQRVVDRGVQLHGGYGYMAEYPIARAWIDSRIQTIYAGTTEVMKEIIGRSLGL
ncbi:MULTISPECIES: acyl-CoA dehydrogenase family protein [Streptomyces]|uniref:acyl-CoA dehydrogenase family protein n=1 Tax=Streptomyces TaxID=1883 RepID=UPI0029AEBDB8|nr:acyl-CoA dehydrogenase family protein [Streptomyces europaeiscabiei]MDX3715732.1 acyl-CoA dehydrogenase family protein [Streptomyces europaeiscabiei]WSG20051.1 acyl-CoA dehydrogenase family protein [Streptomyces europaeiscabiei]